MDYSDDDFDISSGEDDVEVDSDSCGSIVSVCWSDGSLQDVLDSGDEADSMPLDKKKRGPPRKKFKPDEDGGGPGLMKHDPNLPAGWYRKLVQRAPGTDTRISNMCVQIHSPKGKVFGSRKQLAEYFKKKGITDLDPWDFDFMPCGRSTRRESSIEVKEEDVFDESSDDAGSEFGSNQYKKKRGRPKKITEPDVAPSDQNKKKLGRPKKITEPDVAPSDQNKKKMGRPRKIQKPSVVEDTDTDEEAQDDDDDNDDRDLLKHDPNLPPGWYRTLVRRAPGVAPSQHRVCIHSPEGKKFYQRTHLEEYFQQNGITDLKSKEFDFTPFGNNLKRSGTKRIDVEEEDKLEEASFEDSDMEAADSDSCGSIVSACWSDGSLQDILELSDLDEPQTQGKDAPARPESVTNDGSSEVMEHDPQLPPDWYRKVRLRKTGPEAGQHFVRIYNPKGKSFRSRKHLAEYFKENGIRDLKPQDFNFSPFGQSKKKRGRPRKITEPEITPVDQNIERGLPKKTGVTQIDQNSKKKKVPTATLR